MSVLFEISQRQQAIAVVMKITIDIPNPSFPQFVSGNPV